MDKRNRKTTFSFIKISKDLRRKAYAIYGKPLPQEIQERLNIEVNSIIENRLDILYMITSKLVEKSKKYGYLTGYRGCLGSSLVAYLLGITECNPLPKKYGVFNIPFEIFAGVDFNKYLDINLNIATDIYKKICKYLDQLLKGHKICTNYGGIKVINGIYSFKRDIAKMTGKQIGNIVLLSDDNQVYLKKLYDLTNINPKTINLNNVCMSDFTIANKMFLNTETEIMKKIIQKTQEENLGFSEDISTIEKFASDNDGSIWMDLTAFAGNVYKNTGIRCVSIYMNFTKEVFIGFLSSIKTKLLEIFIALDKEFGNLDELDINTSGKNLEDLNEKINVIIFQDNSVNIGDKNKLKDSFFQKLGEKKDGFWKSVLVNIISELLWKIICVIVSGGVIVFGIYILIYKILSSEIIFF